MDCKLSTRYDIWMVLGYGNSGLCKVFRQKKARYAAGFHVA